MSNKKTLLNEGTIRRFMALANMDNLAESYLDRYEVNEGEEDEEEVEEGMDVAKDDDEKELDEMRLGEEEEEIEMGAEEPAAEPEMELGMDAPEEEPADGAGGADEAMVKKLVDAIAGAIEQETGVEVAVEGGEEEPEMDMGAPEEGGEEEVEMGAEAEGGEEPPMGDLEEDEAFDAYIAEVTRRVTKRIIKKKISK